jgi:uncharacterized protein YjbI with pentapeptide repeats
VRNAVFKDAILRGADFSGAEYNKSSNADNEPSGWPLGSSP